MRGLLVAAVFVATLAHAVDPVFVTGWDANDGTAGTGRDSLEGVLSTPALGAVDADLQVCVQGASCTRVRGASNGGDGTSKWALRVSPTDGDANAYLSLPTTITTGLTGTQLAVGFSLGVETAPASTKSRTLVVIREDTTVPALGTDDNDGCFVRLNTNRTLSVFWRTTATSFGSTAEIIQPDHCSNDPTKPCTSSSDCVSAAACTACNTTTGAGCYLAGLELIERNLGSTTVDCQLYVNGRLSVGGTPVAISSGSVGIPMQVRIGAPPIGTEDGTGVWYLDDTVIIPTDRAGWGYVAAAYPTVAGSSKQWTKNSCVTGSEQNCIDDYGVSTFVYDSGDYFQANKPNRTEAFVDSTAVTVTSPLTTAAVSGVLVGLTSSTPATRDMGFRLLVCTDTCSGSTCVSGGQACTGTEDCCSASTDHLFSVATDTTDRVLDRVVIVNPPGATASNTWDATKLSALGLRFRTQATHTGSTFTRVTAALAYARVARLDAPLPVTLKDHNKGTDDGKIAIATIGDSTNGGTLAFTCVGGGANAGTLCTYDSYCSWKADTKDKPIGGCSNDNTVCRTCISRRDDFNAAAGYPCTGGADCLLGTCTSSGCDNGLTNCCTSDTTVSCTTNADCDLGDGDGSAEASDCSSTATCEPSCLGGGTCASGRAAWGALLKNFVGADLILQCGVGTETLPQMKINRFDTFDELSGLDPFCSAVGGTTPYGACQCSTGADCGGGGTCTGGLCTAGDATRVQCTTIGDCAGGKYCDFANPDYVATMEGYNDNFTYFLDPTCSGPTGAVLQDNNDANCPDCAVCDNCVDTYCTANSDCTTTAAASQCFGLTVNSTRGCYTSGLRGAAGTCTVEGTLCRTTADCPFSGMKCTTNDPGALTAAGFCRCTTENSTAQCNATGTTYKCVGVGGSCGSDASVCGYCRRTCSVDGDCNVTGLSGICASGVCKGRCTCPDGSCPGTKCTTGGTTCSTDSQCPSHTVTRQQTVRVHQGTCDVGVTNKCICTGLNACWRSSTCRAQYQQWHLGAQHFVGLQAFRDIQAEIDALGEGASAPKLIALTLPDTMQPDCETDRPEKVYVQKLSRHLLAEFPLVVDARTCMGRYAQSDTMRDDVHPNATGGNVIAKCVGDFTTALNACAVGTGATATAQKYCRGSDNTWTSTICTTSAGCSGTQTCQVRPCTSGTDCPNAGDSCRLE